MVVEHDERHDLLIQQTSGSKLCCIERTAVRRYDVTELQCFVVEYHDSTIPESEL